MTTAMPQQKEPDAEVDILMTKAKDVAALSDAQEEAVKSVVKGLADLKLEMQQALGGGNLQAKINSRMEQTNRLHAHANEVLEQLKTMAASQDKISMQTMLVAKEILEKNTCAEAWVSSCSQWLVQVNTIMNTPENQEHQGILYKVKQCSEVMDVHFQKHKDNINKAPAVVGGSRDKDNNDDVNE